MFWSDAPISAAISLTDISFFPKLHGIRIRLVLLKTGQYCACSGTWWNNLGSTGCPAQFIKDFRNFRIQYLIYCSRGPLSRDRNHKRYCENLFHL